MCQAILYLNGNLPAQCPSLPPVEFPLIPAGGRLFSHEFLPTLPQISLFLSFSVKETSCETLTKQQTGKR